MGFFLPFFFPDRRSSTSQEAESSPALVSESVKWEISKETLGGSIFSPGMGLLGQSSVHMTPSSFLAVLPVVPWGCHQ